MRFLLITTRDPEVWETLRESERNEVSTARVRFQRQIVETGELCSSIALADPSKTRTVRITDHGTAVTNGPRVDTGQFLAGCYVVECETLERATELAAALPEARYTAVEVRPVMQLAGMEM